MPTGVQTLNANADKTPMSQMSLIYKGNDGEIRIPALDKRWAARDVFATYHSLMGSGGRLKCGVELEEWHYEAAAFLEDMEFLLNQRQHVFWSYMIYQKSALAAVVSFLQHCTPFYAAVFGGDVVPPDELDLYEKILNAVLRIICRLITNKETETEWLDKEQHRQLLYTNYLISIPMLLDLIVAIGDTTSNNTEVLKRIFRTLLKIEPQYKRDLTSALAFYRAAFQSIQTQAENEGFEGAGGGAPEENEETPYDDVSLYTLDCAYTLSVLLEVSAEARTICAEIKLAKSIALFYDNTIPYLYKNICLISETASSLGWLNQARLQLLKAFRSIAYSFVEAVLNKPEESLVPSENYIGLLTECLSEQTFAIDYERQYSVEVDVDILRQACKDLDDIKTLFVVSGYKREAEAESHGTIGNMALILEEVDQERQGKGAMQLAPQNATATAKAAVVMPKSANIAGAARDIDLEVTEVIDVLPHLGTGFARRLVERYDTKEEAIAAVLEENLPPDLQTADHAEVYIPADPQDKLYHDTGVKHFNVYDGDEYDVMTQDKPNCIIKQGKGMPNEARNAAELLDDKRDLQLIRHRYENYTLVAENDNEDDEYNDEYDDSYEAVLESETKVKAKSKEMRAALANVNDVSDGDDDDDEEEDVDEEPNKVDDGEMGHNDTMKGKRMDFCENPEVIRARYEARRQAKWGNRGGSSGGGGGGGQKYDVVGGAKGQGQDKDVLKNRNKKEVNKSSRANHNRKAGAAFKRNKGMIS